MSVRVGIDARRYHPTGRGQERYVRSLVHALAAAPVDHEYVLLARRGSGAGRGLGPRVRSVPATRRLRLQYRTRLAGVRRFLVRDLDVVHFPLADGWYRRVAPNVVTIHDLSMLRFPETHGGDPGSKRQAWKHHTAIAASADAVIAGSQATAGDVQSLLGVPAERVTVVHHGVDPMFRPVSDPRAIDDLRQRHGLPPRYVLFVGGVDFKKNVARLVEAYALARRMAGIDHGLVLAGPLQGRGNPFFDRAAATAAGTGVEDGVTWAGFVPDADLPALYSGADAFVFPSLVEGFGFPVVEAMACGTPVVTADRSATAEVADGAAVLVDPEDPEAIALGILRVLDEEQSTTLVRAGLRRAAQYTWDRTAERTIEVYERVAAGEPQPVEVST